MIVQKKNLRGEMLHTNENVVIHWEQKLLSLMEGHLSPNIYNADEIGLL